MFPNDIDTFVDLFGGGFNVGINVNANKIYYNDIIPQVVDLFKNFQLHTSEEIDKIITQIIDDYGLSKSDINGYDFYNCNSNDGLSPYNKEKFVKLRNDYNNDLSWSKFYTIVIYAFSNQIRFNSKQQFNMPCGKRDYNTSIKEKLKAFVDTLHNKNVNFECNDFRKLKVDNLHSNDLVYCDPPYLDSTATYNENGGWTVEQENDLRDMLVRLNNKGIKFALSNNLIMNITLQDWAEQNQFNIHYLNGTYSNCNYQKKDKITKDIEVLITNY